MKIKVPGSPGIEYSISTQSLLARVIVKNTTSGGTSEIKTPAFLAPH